MPKHTTGFSPQGLTQSHTQEVFTGLIKSLCRVSSVSSSRLEVTPISDLHGLLEVGESIAINGTCLTVLPESSESSLTFDVSPETFSRTSLGGLVAGSIVNVERAMTLDTRLGGHIVQGHVDATGELVDRRVDGEFSIFTFQAPPDFDRYLIDKGSIAIDGISLTVVEPKGGLFTVWLIPSTLTHTNLQHMKPGDRVNLEFDMIAKYVEKLMSAQSVAV